VAHPGSETRPGKAAHGPFSPAVTYELVGAGGDVVGWAGRVKFDALDLPPWAGDVLGLEVVLPQEPPAKAGFAADPPPSHPASGRDLAFLVPATVAAGAVADAIRDGGGELLESVTIFDLYEGDDLPSGSRSVAYGLSFRARDRTLKDEEVDEAVQRILRRVREMTGVEPRV
jgi:phenylalanyl-tRNA synthetase beta chain